MKYNTYPIHSSVAGFLLRYRPMYYALPLVRIEEEGEGILDSYPNLKLTTTWRHCEQSLVRCSHHARDMFFAVWPPMGVYWTFRSMITALNKKWNVTIYRHCGQSTLRVLTMLVTYTICGGGLVERMTLWRKTHYRVMHNNRDNFVWPNYARVYAEGHK